MIYKYFVHKITLNIKYILYIKYIYIEYIAQHICKEILHCFSETNRIIHKIFLHQRTTQTCNQDDLGRNILSCNKLYY